MDRLATISVVIILLHVVSVSCRCSTTTITFSIKNHGPCNLYENGTKANGTCEVEVCGDGRHHHGNCWRGERCIEGDPVDGFFSIYGDLVTNVSVSLGPTDALSANYETNRRSITLYEHLHNRGARISIDAIKGRCVTLPREWRMRVSSYSCRVPAKFYHQKDCRGRGLLACKNFDNHHDKEFVCEFKNLNDNTRSFRIDE